jgi:putative phosphoesterase
MPRGARRLPDRCVDRIRRADAVIHAGDFVTVAVLEELESFGHPVYGVQGNVDEASLRSRLPEAVELELAGARIGVVQDAGPRKGRAERLRAMFPQADCAVFGHSHLPEHRRLGDFQIFNPGSPTERRRAPERSMGILRIRDGVPRFRLVSL